MGQPVLAQLAREQVLGGDADLFPGGVAPKGDHFQPVAQRPGQLGQVVGRGDEQGARQVKGRFQIIVHELAVLLRVEHLQKHRRRIAPEVLADLVDLIEHEDRVGHAQPGIGLEHPAGQRADVGAAMAAQLGLVAKPRQGNAVETPPEGLGDGLPHRGLARARRAGETQHRAAKRGRRGFFLGQPGHGGPQLVEIDRLGQVVDRPLPHGFHGRVHGGESRHQHHPGGRRQPPGFGEQLQAVHLVHLEVGDDEVELASPHLGQGFQAIGRPPHLVAFLAQHVLQIGSGDVLVVHHQHMEIRGRPQRPGSQVFEHPVLDLAQAMVAGVEDRLGLG